MIRWRGCSAALASFCLAACAGLPVADYRTASPTGVPDRVELAEVPFYPQERYQCGPAALATALTAAGIPRRPADLEATVYLPGREGSLQPEMLAAARRAGALPYPLAPTPDSLLREVAAGHPVVVLQNLGLVLPTWHYAVVVGYDLENRELILRSGTDQRLVMAIDAFDRSWARAERWAFVALPPERLPATAREADFLAAAAALERVSPAAAKRAYSAALGAWPGNLVAQMGLGNAAYRLGDRAAALAAFRQAAATHPDSADAWNNLAQTLHESGQAVEALAAAHRAVALGGPRRATYESTLAAIENAVAARPEHSCPPSCAK